MISERHQDKRISGLSEEQLVSFATAGNFARQSYAAYEELLRQENEPADPSEMIAVPVRFGSTEAAMLQASGVGQEVIESGKIARSDLMKAGFVFINTIGGGEKPLLSTVIEGEDNGQPVNTGQRLLLTQAELDAVRALQPDSTTEENEMARLLMLGFMHQARGAYSERLERERSILRAAQNKIVVDNEDGAQLVGGYFSDLLKSGDDAFNWAAKEWLAGLDTASVGAIPVDMYASRQAAIHGAPSPFLDSGYHFSENIDITLYPNDYNRTLRLNAVVVHLLSRGLNQMGSSMNGSHDQTYVTSNEFMNLLPLAIETDESMEQSAIEVVADRILYRAQASAESRASDQV